MTKRTARRARSSSPLPAAATPAARPAFALGAFLLIAAGFLLYWDTLRYPLVLDDVHLSEYALKTDYAHAASRFGRRWFSDATFGWTYALFGKAVLSQRLVNVLLHAMTGVVLFGFLSRLFDAVIENPRSRWLAFIGAVLFVLHPVAVYGVAYLMQRSIILATLFSLLSLWGVLEWLLRGSPGWYIAAAAAYYLAVFSKEHAVMVPAVAVALAVLVRGGSLELARRAVWPVALFAAIGVIVILDSKGVLGRAYEPFASNVIGYPGEARSQFDDSFARPPSGLDTVSPDVRSRFDAGVIYPLSMLNQATLYFRYLFTWLLPWPGWMSIDVRTRFPQTIFEWQYLLGFAAWLTYPIAAVWLLFKRGGAGLFGFGLLYPWLLALTEVATVRVQEPFVLYRSYLWMSGLPAIVPMLAAILAARWRTGVIAVVCVLLAISARNRLDTFSSGLKLWDDTISKNTDVSAPNVERAYIDRGIVHFQAGRFEAARADLERAVAINPRSPGAHLVRGTLRLHSGALNAALEDINLAIALDARYSAAYDKRCLVMTRLGSPEKAIIDCEKAVELDPRNYGAWMNTGAVYHALGRTTDAAASYRHALELRPADAFAHYQYGMHLIGTGRRDEAVRTHIAIGCEAGITAACEVLRGQLWSGASR